MEPLVLDPHEKVGWIEVICGSMFSGKTEELLRRLRRARIARQRVDIFKPAMDTRFSKNEVVSHDETSTPTNPVHAATQIVLMAEDADVIGIDEAQFFDNQLVDVCMDLAGRGKRVIVAGLDQDFRAEPFEPIPQLMAIAEYVTKLHAICVKCGAPANHSQRLQADEEQVLLGATEAYEPRCRRCFVHPSKGTPTPAAPPTDALNNQDEREDSAPQQPDQKTSL